MCSETDCVCVCVIWSQGWRLTKKTPKNKNHSRIHNLGATLNPYYPHEFVHGCWAKCIEPPRSFKGWKWTLSRTPSCCEAVAQTTAAPDRVITPRPSTILWIKALSPVVTERRRLNPRKNQTFQIMRLELNGKTGPKTGNENKQLYLCLLLNGCWLDKSLLLDASKCVSVEDPFSLGHLLPELQMSLSVLQWHIAAPHNTRGAAGFSSHSACSGHANPRPWISIFMSTIIKTHGSM